MRSSTFVLPLAIAAWVAYKYLPGLALTPADTTATWAGGIVGAALGVLASLFIRVAYDPAAKRQ